MDSLHRWKITYLVCHKPVVVEFGAASDVHPVVLAILLPKELLNGVQQ